MMNGQVLVLIILMSVVDYNTAIGVSNCEVKDGFNVYKLEGTWHFIGGIYPQQVEVECGYITLDQKSKHRFTGSAVESVGGVKRRWAIQSYVHDGIFAVRYMENSIPSEEILLNMRTCNDDIEFSLEIPKDNVYLLFIRNTALSQQFLSHYTSLSRAMQSTFHLVNNTSC